MSSTSLAGIVRAADMSKARPTCLRLCIAPNVTDSYAAVVYLPVLISAAMTAAAMPKLAQIPCNGLTARSPTEIPERLAHRGKLWRRR